MAVKILCPLMGSLDSGQWSLRQRSSQNAAYVAVFAQRYLKRKDATDEGVIYAQRLAIHLSPSNDGLEFFAGYTPVQNLHVHSMHILTPLHFIKKIFQSLD